jgi:molybdopterin molybdotransferase
MTTGPDHREVDWEQARDLARAAGRSMPARQVELADAAGLTSAVVVTALTDIPVAATSAMDGFAVAGPGPWTVVGRLTADVLDAAPLHPGQAYEIATGALLPDGADRVVPYENAGTADDPGVVTEASPTRKSHVRPAGGDAREGDELLPAGVRLTPAALGLVAAGGWDSVAVCLRPRVGLLVSGDELVRSGPSRPGRIRDAIGPMLPGLVTAAGGEVVDSRLVRDDQILDAVGTLTDVDVIVMSGSTSRGMSDRLSELAALGEIVFRGVRCRPGHPQALVRFPDGRVLIALPGNPFAAWTSFQLTVRALLAAMVGAPRSDPVLLPVTGATDALPGRVRLAPVIPVDGGLTLVPSSSSAHLVAAASALGLAVLDEHWVSGQLTPVLVLR